RIAETSAPSVTVGAADAATAAVMAATGATKAAAAATIRREAGVAVTADAAVAARGLVAGKAHIPQRALPARPDDHPPPTPPAPPRPARPPPPSWPWPPLPPRAIVLLIARFSIVTAPP